MKMELGEESNREKMPWGSPPFRLLYRKVLPIRHICADMDYSRRRPGFRTDGRYDQRGCYYFKPL